MYYLLTYEDPGDGGGAGENWDAVLALSCFQPTPGTNTFPGRGPDGGAGAWPDRLFAGGGSGGCESRSVWCCTGFACEAPNFRLIRRNIAASSTNAADVPMPIPIANPVSAAEASSSVGESVVGDRVGKLVAIVGAAEGNRDGDRLGDPLGEKEGAAVGSNVGDPVHCSITNPVT